MTEPVTDKSGGSTKHWVLVVLYWLILIGLLGEFSIPKDQSNPALVPLFTLVVLFGVWRVIRKWRRTRR